MSKLQWKHCHYVARVYKPVLINCAITIYYYFAMEKSVTALQTILLFGVVKHKLFFSNFFTNQDSKGYKHFQWDRKFTIVLIRTKGIGDELLIVF